MSEDENVLARWSRLKQERARRDGEKQATEDPKTSRPPEPDATGDHAASAFDVASLPPLESIVAGSDIRAFLQAGVPASLTRAALRLAWSSDPSIRDFIEMAENQWDFANPDAIPGFGPLTGADDIPQLVAKALGEWRDDQEAIAEGSGAGNPAPHPSERDSESAAIASTAGPQSDLAADLKDAAPKLESARDRERSRAPQQNEDAIPDAAPGGPPRRRGHGGALPS